MTHVNLLDLKNYALHPYRVNKFIVRTAINTFNFRFCLFMSKISKKKPKEQCRAGTFIIAKKPKKII